jgi:tetratricopeptide (TPR) repeat protein
MTSPRPDRRAARSTGRARRPPGIRPAPEARATAAAAPASTSQGDAAALVLLAFAALLVAARAALSFGRGMALWSLDVQRFLAPGWAWAPWALMALALLPRVARALSPALRAAGDALAERPGPATLAWMAAAAALVLAFPDRVRFVGDFLLRQGAIEENVRPSTVFPQALPLDVLLHVTLPAWLMDQFALGAAAGVRALDALEAALLAALAAAYARALGLRGVAALTAMVTVLFGGALTLLTGYSKSLTELALLTAAVALFATRVVREGRGLLSLGIVLALGALLHRSALGFLPAVAFAWIASAADPARRAAWRRPQAALAVALPVVAFAAMLPRMVHTLAHGDAPVHFASDEVVREGGLFSAMLAGARGWDLASVVLLMAPFVVVTPVLAWLLRARLRAAGRGRELTLLLLLALPFVLLLLAIHPAQGMFRDWDDFAETGVALSLLAAWLLGETLDAAPRRAWVAAAVVAATALPTVQWMAMQSDVARGMARVQAFLTEPPARTEGEQGKTWDYLGIRNYRLERWDAAAVAFEHAARTAPSPRVLSQWAMAELQRNDYPAARTLYARVVARDSTDTFAWTQLAGVAMQLGDTLTMRRAATAILRVKPNDPDGLGILRVLASGQAKAR